MQGSLNTESKQANTPNSYLTNARYQLASNKTDEISYITDLIKGSKVELKPNSTQAFPNPATSLINIGLAEYVGEQATISIVNTLGQTIKTIDIEEVEDRSIMVELNSFKQGVYLIQVNIDGLLMDSHKFIKQ